MMCFRLALTRVEVTTGDVATEVPIDHGYRSHVDDGWKENQLDGETSKS